jgi:DNA primase
MQEENFPYQKCLFFLSIIPNLDIISSMIEKESIEALKSSIDIVDVIGNYLELKKAGSNYKANCPFHGEKTPSFVVSPSKQIFHCFGCGVGGDAIKFVMDYEKLSYPEAVEKLASSFNFSLRYTQGDDSYSGIKRILESIQIWYVKTLEHTLKAKEYLTSRGISQNSIEKFGIGYVSDSQSVIKFLNSTHLPLPKAVEAGILAQDNKGNLYARLIDRVIFPIYSPSGAIVGFGGRTMSNHPAKYINSPQTKLFNKSRLLYGYNLAKDTIYKTKQIIVCEGYLDVIMLHQAGFESAVATLGTALTSEHLPLLRKGEPKVILAYDGDKAGVAAALKAAKMLSSGGFDGGVVLFPDGLDPADMVANEQIDKLAQMFRDPKPLIPFVLEMIASQYDLSSPRAKEVAFGEMRTFLASLSEIIKESYTPIAASILGVSPKLFTTNAKISQNKERIATNSEDIAYLSILKTLIEDSSLVDSVVDVVDSEMFDRYKELYEAILSKDTNNPNVVRLSLDDNIKVLNEQELKDILIGILIKYYDKKLKQIVADTTMQYAQKSFLIRKIRTDIIPRLKRGELAYYHISIPR